MKKFKKISSSLSKIISNRFVKWVLIPVVLIIFWLTSSVLYSSHESFTVLEFAHGDEVLRRTESIRLYRGTKINGSFTAKEDNLGIVALRFGYVPRVEFDKQDIIIFKIREKGNNNWISENEYKSGSFETNRFFPFGFAVQEYSKSKTYEFELHSIYGDAYNAVQIRNSSQNFLSKYKFTKSEILTDKNSLLRFAGLKLTSFVTNTNALFSSLVFLLPLLLYGLWSLFKIDSFIKNKGLASPKKLLILFVYAIIFIDIIFNNISNSGFILGIIGLWIYSIHVNKYSSKSSYVFSFVLIIISVITIYLSLEFSVNKITTYAYLLLIIGIIHSFIEQKKLL